MKSSFFVSGFIGLLENPDFDKINKTFVDRDFNWDKIRKNCDDFHLYHSDNDPYLPIEKAEELASYLKTKVHIIKNAGHFNEEVGYDKFELLLDEIKKYLNL